MESLPRPTVLFFISYRTFVFVGRVRREYIIGTSTTATCSRITDEIERHIECVMCALRILFWAMSNEENIDCRACSQVLDRPSTKVYYG
jgi:DNA-directed RNA polymerase subunit RPC12/RpoP